MKCADGGRVLLTALLVALAVGVPEDPADYGDLSPTQPSATDQFRDIDAGAGKVQVIRARSHGALCLEHVSPQTVSYRHCRRDENSEAVSLLEVGESINVQGNSARLGDTDDLYKENLIPELGDSNADQVKQALAAPKKGTDNEEAEEAQRDVDIAKKNLDAAKKRSDSSDVHLATSQVRSAIHHAVKTAVSTVAAADVKQAEKAYAKAKKRLQQVAGLAASPENKKLDEDIGTAKGKVIKLQTELNAADAADKVKLRGDLAVAKAEVEVAEAKKKVHFATDLSKPSEERNLLSAEAQVKVEHANAKLSIAKHELFHATSADHINKAKEDIVAAKREVVKTEADAEQFIGPGYSAMQDAKRARQDRELRELRVENLSEKLQANPNDTDLVGQLEQAKTDLQRAKEQELKKEEAAKKARSAASVNMREKAAQAAQKAEDLKAKLDTIMRTIAELKGSQNDPAALDQAQKDAKSLQRQHQEAVTTASMLANQLNGAVSSEVKAVTQKFTQQMQEQEEESKQKEKGHELVEEMRKEADGQIQQQRVMSQQQSARDAEAMRDEVTQNLHTLEANTANNAQELQAASATQLKKAQSDANRLEKDAEQEAKRVENEAHDRANAAEEKERNLVTDAESMKESAQQELSDAKDAELASQKKSHEAVENAEREAEDIRDKEREKAEHEEEEAQKKSHEEIEDAREKAESILHRAREAERDHLKGAIGAQGQVSLSGANTIQASDNRYLCLSRKFDSAGHLSAFAYMECHNHAKCETAKGVKCTCEEGYTGTGTRCNRVDCGGIVPPINGVVRCPEGSTVGKTCLVSCIDGYILFGPEEHQCQENGKYKNIGVEKKCRKIACDVKQQPANALMTCTGHGYGDTCRFTCEEGFLLEGSSDVTCQSTGAESKGKWVGSAGETRCRRVDCQAPAVPAKATVNCRGTTFGKKCEFVCDKDTKQTTPRVHECGADGKWIGEPVICESLACDVMQFPQGGRAVCTGTSIGSACNYVCDEGFKLAGPKTRTCVKKVMGTSATAEWDASDARCDKIDCGPHKSLINGNAKCDGHAFGNSCDITCDEGYHLEGSTRRNCRLDGKWSGVEPKCREVDCGELEKPEGGTMVCSGQTYQKICEFACKKGLVLSGAEKRQCQKDGFWSGKRAFCSEKTCEKLPDPLNGRVNCDGIAFGSTCTHRCNKGYTLAGTARRFCSDEEKWSGKEVTCTATKCGEPSDPPFGSVKCNGDAYGSTCVYSCNEGYEISGNAHMRRCKSNGYWSGSAVTCKPRDCGKLSPPPDGYLDCPKGSTMGNTCTFSCNPGFMLSDEENSKQRTCQKTGEWSGALAECAPVNCGQPYPPGGAVANCALGTQLHSTCTLQCPQGYKVPGKGILKCMNDGKWFGPMECVEVECPEPPRPDYGTISCAGTTVGKTCTYGCKKGWNLSGSPTRSCMQSGKWSGVQPKCVPTTCAALLQPPGGTMKCRSANGAFSSTNIRYGAYCNFACEYGYGIEGSRSRSCKDDGSWSGSAAACNPIDCKPPAAIRGCEHKCEAGTTLGKECIIRGRKGFTLEGAEKEKKITCTGRGTWTKTDAVCVAAECPSLDSMVAGFGKVICTNKQYRESKCGLTCNNNLMRTGPRVKECLSGSQWSVGNFACKPVPSRAVEFGGLGDRAPVFSFYSTAGDVSMRLESLGSDPRSVYLELQNGKKGNFIKSWMVGMMNNFGMSFCYGTETSMSSNVCPLKISADGVVHIEGAAYFHEAVRYDTVPEEKRPVQANATNATDVDSENTTSSNASNVTATAFTDSDQESSRVEELGEPNTGKVNQRDPAVMNDGEISEDNVKVNKVWWNDENTLVSLLQTQEATGESEEDKAKYFTRVGGEGAQTPAAKWLTENGKIGLRLESQNSLEAKNVYLEMRNKGRRDSWGVGLRKDLSFYLGYGDLDTYAHGTRKNAMKMSPSKDVTFMKDVILYKEPSYFKPGTELDLEGYTAPSSFDAEPSYGSEVKVQTKSAVEVPEVPITSDDSLGTSASAEPVIAYHSNDNLSIRITAESTGALKEAFLEFRSQKRRAWRIAVHSDGSLYFTFHPSASITAGEKVIKLTTDGQVHFYGEVVFGGKTYKKF